MFGEIPLIGKEDINVIDGLFKLPEFTKAEVNETLTFIIYNKELRLYNEKEYLKFTSKLIKKYKQNHGIVDTNKFIRNLYYKYSQDHKVGKKNMISLPFNLDLQNVNVVGAKDHIKIYKKAKKV